MYVFIPTTNLGIEIPFETQKVTSTSTWFLVKDNIQIGFLVGTSGLKHQIDIYKLQPTCTLYKTYSLYLNEPILISVKIDDQVYMFHFAIKNIL